MKAQIGEKIKTTKEVYYGSAYGLITIPEGTTLTVLSRMNSNDGVKTVEQFNYDNLIGKGSISYSLWDADYKIIN